MKKSFITLAICSLMITPLFSQWKSIFLVDYSLSDVYFVDNITGYIVGSNAANNKGIILKTINSGRTWDEIYTSTETVRSIFFHNADTGYALSGLNVLKTNNKGISWNETKLETSKTPLDIVFTSSKTGYIACNDGQLFKTTDAGKTWKKINSPVYTETLNTSISFVNDQVGFMVADYNIHKTINGGTTWERLFPLTYRYNKVFFINEATGYISASTGNIYKTTDGGKTWTGIYSYGIIPWFISENTGFLFDNYSMILRTGNASVSFDIVYNSQWDFSWKAVHFADEKFGCAIGSDNTIVITRDGGNYWQLVNITPPTGSYRDMHFSSDLNGIAIGVNRGVFRTDDGGKIWYFDERTFRGDLFMLSFADNNNGLVAVTNNWAYFTSDGGRSFYEVEWTVPIVGLFESFDYFMTDPSTIYTVGLKVQLSKSINRGETWTPYYNFGFYNGLNRIICTTMDTCYACGTSGKIVKTSNAGDTWETLDKMTIRDLHSIFFYDSYFGFAGGDFGALVRTINGGETWEFVSTGLFATIYGIHFYDYNHGVIVSERGEIAVTSDAGTSWKTISEDDNLLVDVADFYFKDYRIYAMGGSIYYYDLGFPVSEEIHLFENDILKSGPNPAQEYYFIDYKSGYLTGIKVTDFSGRVVCNIPNLHTSHYELPLNNIPPGAYIIKIETDGERFFRKMVKR